MVFLLLLKPDEVSFAWGKEVLAGMLGHLNPSLKGAKIRLGMLEWSSEMAKARGEQGEMLGRLRDRGSGAGGLVW